jgi:hypothetical protein
MLEQKYYLKLRAGDLGFCEWLYFVKENVKSNPPLTGETQMLENLGLLLKARA